MLNELTEREYAQLRLRLSRRREVVAEHLAAAFTAIVDTQFAKLTGSEITLLLYLLRATIGNGQLAREISIRELCVGTTDSDRKHVLNGTGLSENGVRAAIKRLSDDAILQVYREQNASLKDHSARIYEIDFTSIDPSLAERFEDCLPEKEPATPAKNAVPPFKNCRGVNTSNVVTNDLQSEVTSNFFLAGSEVASEGQVGEIDFVGYVGKKQTKTFASAAEAIAAVATRSAAKVQGRAAAAVAKTPADISKAEMQALFDTAGKAAGLAYRLMVTNKEYGFLRKKLVANPPKDFADMVRYSLTYWGVLSQQNSRAIRKDGERRVVSKALPEAPHFQTFAYWYPYFFRAYQNFLAGSQAAETMARGNAEAEAKIREAQARAAAAENSVAVLRRRIEYIKPGVQHAPAGRGVTTPARRVVKPSRPANDDLAADVAFPDWESAQGGRA